MDKRYDIMSREELIEAIKEKEEIIRRIINDSFVGYERDELTNALLRRNGFKLINTNLLINGDKSYLCFMDMDNLKYINDNYGHIHGDKALKIFIDTVFSNIRSNDLVVRVGGDEFIIYFSNTTEIECHKIITRIHTVLSEISRTLQYKIDFSSGIVKCSSNNTINELISVADRNMYNQKKLKTNNTRHQITSTYKET